MPGPREQNDYLRGGRQDRLIRELDHDPYKSKRKLTEPTVCPDCGAVFHKGRWQWATPEPGAHEVLCPACDRIRDKVPAAFVSIGGSFYEEHRDELNNLLKHVEERQKGRHPLERIMWTESEGHDTLYSVTDHHLARAMGEALHDAYEGELDYEYTEGETMLRVSWHR